MAQLGYHASGFGHGDLLCGGGNADGGECLSQDGEMEGGAGVEQELVDEARHFACVLSVGCVVVEDGDGLGTLQESVEVVGGHAGALFVGGESVGFA